MDGGIRVLSRQEEIILGNKQDNLQGRERTMKLLKELKETPVKMDINRAKYFTESFMQTEGKPLSLRWALALKNIAEKLPVTIHDGELIVGKVSDGFGRNGILYPELEGPALMDVRGCEHRSSTPYQISTENLEYIENILYPYWRARSFAQVFADNLPQETRRIIFGNDLNNSSRQTGITLAASTGRSSIAWCYDYKSMFDLGINGLKAEAEQRLAEAKKDPATLALHGSFWEATLITLEALSILMKRYAQEAQRQLEQEKNLKRKAELEKIASKCSWITENPQIDNKKT